MEVHARPSRGFLRSERPELGEPKGKERQRAESRGAGPSGRPLPKSRPWGSLRRTRSDRGPAAAPPPGESLTPRANRRAPLAQLQRPPAAAAPPRRDEGRRPPAAARAGRATGAAGAVQRPAPRRPPGPGAAAPPGLRRRPGALPPGGLRGAPDAGAGARQQLPGPGLHPAVPGRAAAALLLLPAAGRRPRPLLLLRHRQPGPRLGSRPQSVRGDARRLLVAGPRVPHPARARSRGAPPRPPPPPRPRAPRSRRIPLRRDRAGGGGGRGGGAGAGALGARRYRAGVGAGLRVLPSGAEFWCVAHVRALSLSLSMQKREAKGKKDSSPAPATSRPCWWPTSRWPSSTAAD